MKALTLCLLKFTLPACFASSIQAAGPPLSNPILFVTQVPQPMDFTTVTAMFGNHRGTAGSAPRGGDLWIRYADGYLKNLTKAAGFGQEGTQSPSGIAVREPCVHWNGTKAVFSMVIGAPLQYKTDPFYWQLYEITNFLDPATYPVITKVPNQPANFNNVAPCYGTDDRIIFASDRPRDGQLHLYPQLDEYEEAPTVTGLWSLDPASGDLFMMNHSPSGVFSTSMDSYGRVIFSRWDHLERDQQADLDGPGGQAYGTFNYASEMPGAAILTNNRAEIFPEPGRAVAGSSVQAHRFNHFFPWQINEDGTEEETLGHVGRQELGGTYANRSFSNDPNLHDLYYFGSKFNTNPIVNFVQPRESPVTPGWYFGVDAPEFGTHSAGQIIALEANIATNADFFRIHYFTHRSTANISTNPGPAHSGLYRNPLPLSNGQLVAVHTPVTVPDQNIGSSTNLRSRYDFRLKLLAQTNGVWFAEVPLTPGLSNAVQWWSPDVKVHYSGELWELDPVEVRPQTRPARIQPHLAAPEATVFQQEGVNIAAFQRYLRNQNLALIIGRNVTSRDAGDRQQPFNLKVAGNGGTQTLGAGGKIYEISHLSLYQADMIRGIGMYGGTGTPRAGRRVLAQHMHDPAVDNPPNPSGPPGSVKLGLDGSFASFVPARRAMAWQTTDDAGTAVVRERYWLTFQPGEIRTCASCHGVNQQNQAGLPSPTNPPEALRELLRYWKTQTRYSGFRSVVHAENQVVLEVSTGLNRTNIIEVSDNLTHWTPVHTNLGTLNGLFQLSDLEAPQHPRRFYRVLSP